MRFLIGTACVAIIAASGLAVGQPIYEQYKQSARRQSAEDSLFAYVGAKPGDYEEVFKYCRVARTNPEIYHGDADSLLNTCIIAGFPTTF